MCKLGSDKALKQWPRAADSTAEVRGAVWRGTGRSGYLAGCGRTMHQELQLLCTLKTQSHCVCAEGAVRKWAHVLAHCRWPGVEHTGVNSVCVLGLRSCPSCCLQCIMVRWDATGELLASLSDDGTARVSVLGY